MKKKKEKGSEFCGNISSVEEERVASLNKWFSKVYPNGHAALLQQGAYAEVTSLKPLPVAFTSAGLFAILTAKYYQLQHD